MTRKMHYLVAATDRRTFTYLYNVYAATPEEAYEQARRWHEETCPQMPYLDVRPQPQGFQAGFRRLPGFLDEEREESNS